MDRCHVGLALIAWLLLSLLWGGVSWASDERGCRKEYQKKQYVRASQCYMRLYAGVEQKVAGVRQQKLLKDRYLRHASLCYEGAAKAETSPAKAAFLREKAASFLIRSFEAGFCLASYRCRAHRQKVEQLKKQIGYGNLLVIAQTQGTKIVVKGYKYRKAAQQQFNQQLRPGSYQVTIISPKGRTRVRKVALKTGAQLFMNVRAVRIKTVDRQVVVAQKVPRLVLLGYVAGGALAAGGVVMLVVGLVMQNDLNATITDTKRNLTITDREYHEQYDRAEIVYVTGMITAAVGGVLLATVIGTYFATRAKAPVKSAFSNQESGAARPARAQAPQMTQPWLVVE